MASETTISRVLAMLSTGYPDYWNKLSAEQIRQTRQLYGRLLADVDDALLEQATLRHIAGSQWFPKVNELRSAAAALLQPASLDPTEAWEQVRRAILRYGSYYDGIPPFDDPLTAAVVRQMGWKELCLSEFPTADRARFLESYERQAERAATASRLPALLQNGAVASLTAQVAARLASPERDMAVAVESLDY